MGSEPTNVNSATGELVAALEAGQFFLVYQPTIDLETNAFAGVEALIRWRHSSRGTLSPNDFIDELEKTGVIVPVGRWALRTACSDGAGWHDKGYRFNVSVNISTRQFTDPTFVRDVSSAIDLSRFDASLLVLEFAQHTLSADHEMTKTQLGALRDLGVRVAIDDFTPGESAFEDLNEFSIDIVKLDRDFTASLATSRDATSLIHSLVTHSETRHVQVVAAGVEDADQRTTLRKERVHVGQGFLFSHPHEAADIDKYLEDFSIFSGKPL